MRLSSASALALSAWCLCQPALSETPKEVIVINEPTVAISNLPTTTTVEGQVNVANFPGTQNVAGTVNVANFPASQVVQGRVSISNGPTDAISVQIENPSSNPLPVIQVQSPDQHVMVTLSGADDPGRPGNETWYRAPAGKLLVLKGISVNIAADADARVDFQIALDGPYGYLDLGLEADRFPMPPQAGPLARARALQQFDDLPPIRDVDILAYQLRPNGLLPSEDFTVMATLWGRLIDAPVQ